MGNRVNDKGVEIKAFLTHLFDEWGARRPARQAASLAYYSMFSLVPMIFIAITVAELFLGKLVSSEQLFLRIEQVLGPEISTLLNDLVSGLSETTTSSNSIVGLISFLALVFAASGLFAQLKFSLNEIWEAPTPIQSGIMGFIKTRLLAFGLVIGVGLLLVMVATLSIGFSMIRSYFELDSSLNIARIVGLIVIVGCSFAVLYKILPDVHVTWRDVWLGATISAGLIYIASMLAGLYFSTSNLGSAWGAAGALAILLVTVYYFSQIFLLGAVFSKVYAHDYGSKSSTVTVKKEPRNDSTLDT